MWIVCKMKQAITFYVGLITVFALPSLGQEFMTYIQLGSTAGLNSSSVTFLDACSDVINIPIGFPLGSDRHTMAYVCPNGYISFGNPETNYIPSAFPDTSDTQPGVAPFWEDHDVRNGGNISYEVHTSTTSPALLSQVNQFIRNQQQNTFAGIWMLVAEWNSVPTFETTTPTNTYQALVITNGFQSYTVFTYQCGDINWGDGATIGFQAESVYFANHPSSGGSATSVDCQGSGSWNNIIYEIHMKHLPFLTLGVTPGVASVSLPSIGDGDEGASSAIGIPEGFPFGDSTQTIVYVITNGYFSLGALYIDYFPSVFSGAATENYLIAPFWSDVDVRTVGEISYEVHSSLTPTMSLVSTFISQRQQVNFTGTWMLIAYWNNVPQYPSTSTTITNSYQGILITDGQHSYTVFLYNCNQMEWSGDLEASIGFDADGSFYQTHFLSGSANATNIACLNLPDTEWSFLIYQLNGNFVPFLELGITSSVAQTFLAPALDGASDRIDIPGFQFGIENQTFVHVITNGFFSFGRQYAFWIPSLFPDIDNYHIVAPFWADHDSSLGGAISFEVHNSSSGTPTALLTHVNTYIRQQLQTDFRGTWMLIAEWREVPHYLGLNTTTNTYQGIVITDGTQSFAVFIYQCGAMTWPGPNPATIGFNSDGSLFANYELSGTSNVHEVACQSYPNTVWSNLLYTLTFEAILVDIYTSPSGPDYMAATYITIFCNASGGSDLYSYTWRVYCSSTGILMYESAPDSSDSFQVKSTPAVCFDMVECIVEDTTLPLAGSASVIITSVVGVGIFANDNPAFNNSVVLADSNNEIGTIYCSSGSRSSSNGQWFSPDGTEITASSTVSLSVVHGGGNFPSYAGLQLNSGYSITTTEEGVYTCVILDENDIEQILYVGIYRYGFQTVPSVTVTSVSHPLLTINCTTSGAPALVTWNYIGGNIILRDDENHQIIHSLRDGSTGTYDSTIAFAFIPLNETGPHVCIADTTYVSSNTSETNMSTTTGTRHFGLYAVGESVAVNCNSDAATLLQWLDDSGNVVASSSGVSVLLQINLVTDIHNGQVYRCRLYNIGILLIEVTFQIIAFVPVSAPITVQIIPLITGSPAVGSSFAISCTAVDNFDGLTSTPLIEWLGPDGNPVLNTEGITVALLNGSTDITQTITYDSIHTSHSGSYTCMATLNSPTLTIPFITMTSYIVNVSTSPPILVLTQPDGPYYVGSSLTITCTIALHPAIDTGVAVAASWTGPDGMILSNSSLVTVSLTAMVSTQIYETTVTVIDLESSTDAGSYTCSATLTSELVYVIGSSASVTVNVTVEEFTLQVDVIPTSFSILDTDPYNVFTLTCTATAPTSVQQSKVIEWMRSSMGSNTPVTHNGESVLITNSGVSSAISTSILVTSETTAGNVSYTCNATISEITGSDSAVIHVQGSVAPVPATALAFDGITSTTAMLEWTIPYISYTPEQYQIFYGFTETTLDQASQTVDGNADLDSINQIYTIGLTGLLHDTMYYWRVQSTNSFAITESSIATFSTVPLPLVVYIRTNGSSVAGNTFTLICNAIQETNITDSPELQWIGPDGLPILSGSGIAVGDTDTNGTMTTLTLQFSPLSVYHEGQYTCQAYVASTDLLRMSSHNITVQTQNLNIQTTGIPSGPDYHAATFLNISCEIVGEFHEPLLYEWTSTCTGDCFILGSTNATVTQSVLRFIDSGRHTCSVTDAVGNTGAATINVNVFGVGIHYEGTGLLPNNSYVTGDSSGIVRHLQCSSGSSLPDVGSWIAPSGQDITSSNIDPFDVTVGDVSNPGYLSILQASGHSLTTSFQGVYTCILPDENGVERQIHVGIYPYGFNIPPSITFFERTPEISSVFTLGCVSTGSPATSVTWARDGIQLPSDSTYHMTQILIDRATAVYDHQLYINTGPDGITGNYSCSVSNLLGSDSLSTLVTGIQITTSTIIFTVGSTASLTCSSDLDVSSIEWLHNGQVVATTINQQELELEFSPVNDTIHEREYTCRVTSPYGVQEAEHPVIAEVPADEVAVSISAEGIPVAGQQYLLTCNVTYPAGITEPIAVEWRDTSGPISSGEGITVGDAVVIDDTMITISLEFNPLRVTHERLVICQATVHTTALPFSLVNIAELDILVPVLAELQITISSSPDSENNEYIAGSSVSLTCNVNGGHLPLMYEWNSTCSGDCFIYGQNTGTVLQDVLHSIDSGNHTCYVMDYVGHSGSARIEMVITGASLYLEGTGLLQNNSLILATSTGRLEQLQCVTGSTTPNVGSWIAPSGMDITLNNDDAFDIVVGNASDPGYLSIQVLTGYSLSETDWGIYTCIIPDETGELQYLHLGIYPQSFATLPSINSLQILESSNSLILECVSTGSPATSVVWSRDGTGLQSDDFEYVTQILRDGTTATYSTAVSLAGVPCTLSGTYGCTVHDSLGQNSMIETVDVQAISISGNYGPLLVGDTIAITCSSDLDAVAVQWYYNGQLIVNSSGSQAELVFSPVNDSIHNREYICSVLTPSCSIDQATTVIVQVPDQAIMVSITSTASPVAGTNYTITCSVTLSDGLSGFPEVMWIDSDGQEIVSEGDTNVSGPLTSGLVTNLLLEFDPLRISNEGVYTCLAVFSPVILSTEQNSSETIFVDVELVQPLVVSIVDTSDPSQNFVYAPGSTVMLNCAVQGAVEPITYQWNSTCSGDCFILSQQSNSVVEKEVIHSIDSGNHTCSVLDDVGNSGISTVEMQVTGARFYLFDPENPGLFPNNGIIITDNFGQIARMQCISGSQMPDVGQWIAPDGQDITQNNDDQFEIIVGGINDPGYLDITLATGRSLTHNDQGVYTCLIPDEKGTGIELHVGLYLPQFTVVVRIISLQESTTFSSAFVINCTSDGSPPTNVTWYKDEELLECCETYQMVQSLTDTPTATYNNLLVVYADPSSIVGTYSCFVENSISPLIQESITFMGVQIIGNTTLTVGQTATIICYTDVQVEKLEWIYSREIVANSSGQQVDLHFDPVYNYHHNRQYTCRATTSYGIMEEDVTFAVELPPSSLNVSITTVGNSIAGESYELVCMASVVKGIEATPQSLQWLDAANQQIQSDADISIGSTRLDNGVVTLPLEFQVLRVTHTGEYTCHVTVFLPGFDPLVSMATFYINVETIELDVSVVSTPPGPVLNVAKQLTFTCNVQGGTEEYFYQWSSTCTGNCFVTSQMSQSVMRDALHSSDSGNHTCTVLDSAGNSGSDSMTISAIGVGLFVANALGQTPNNSILIASSDGRIPQLQCLSGSRVPNVGQWLNPLDSDLADVVGDPFEITIGGDSNPGSAEIETPDTNLSLSQSYEGIYTCIIPDETEEIHYLHIGIYLNGFDVNPTISSLERVTNSTTLNCTSTGSPATTVIWTKEGSIVTNSASYQMVQVLTDGTTSTYTNLLNILLDPDDLTGSYSCRVMNQIGFSSSETFSIQGLQITGNDATLQVSEISSLTCSSDLDVSSIEWLYSGQVVASSTSQQELELVFSPVNDTIHGREYTCRVTSPYGTQERSVITTVAILDPLALRVSTSAVGDKTAGNPYFINCTAIKLDGVLATPEIMWLDPGGNLISDGEVLTEGNITVSQIDFNALKTSDGGQYTCAVSLTSPALATPLIAMAVVTVTVQIPTPTVTVSRAFDASLLAGSTLVLMCSAELILEVDTGVSVNSTWRRSGEVLSSDGRIAISVTTQVSALGYQSELQFNTLSQIVDPGEYTCEVAVASSPPSIFVNNAMGFDIESLAIQSPTLEVLVTPMSVTVLDVAPYNTFIFTCTATQPSSVALSKAIEWREIRNGVTDAVVENGNSINITTTGLNSPASTSILSVRADTVAESVVSCIASLQVPEDPLISQSTSVQVIVKGPSAPVQPVDLAHTTVASDFVIVQWVVPYIAYTPETYIVRYGETENLYTNTSDVVSGSIAIMATNELYSVRLSNLEPLTDYFYQVVAMNSFASNTSEVAAFTTSSPVLTASVKTEGNSTAAEIFTLICTIAVSEETTGVPTVEWRRRSDGSTVISEESITVGIAITVGQTTTLTLGFGPLKTSHGGQYICQANISTADLESPMTVSVAEDVIVQIPSPSINISGLRDGLIYTGTSLTLTCTVQLHETVDTPVVVTGTWRRSGDLLANGSRIHTLGFTESSALVYETSLSISPLTNTLDSGHYECTSLVKPDSESAFVIMRSASDTLTVNIEALPGPTVAITSEGTTTAGEVYTLTCTFSVINGLVDTAIQMSYWSNSEGNPVTAEDASLLAPTMAGTTTMLPLQFNQLRTSHGGEYFCRVSIYIPELSIQQNSSLAETIVVQIPEPVIAITSAQDENLPAGSYLRLNCSIELHSAVDTQVAVTNLWQRNEMGISSDPRIMISQPIEMGSSQYEGYIEFSTLSSTTDSGTYMCAVTATPSTLQDYITSGSGVASYTITVVDPVISVEVIPLSYTGLDTEPYNDFSLNCTATKSPEVIPSILLTWSHNDTQLDTSALGVSISVDGTSNGAVRSSQLALSADNSSDSGSYSCQATISIPDSGTVQSSQTSIVTIIGPTLPAAPMPLDTVTTTARSAIVSWLVASIAYTPESYTVIYGLNVGSLNSTTDAVQGTMDIAAIDQVYSTTIVDLTPFRQYYYKIIATNSFESTQSSPNTFRTMTSAPTAPPELFQAVSIGARSAILSWELPTESGRNGIITSYSLACSDSEISLIVNDEVTDTSFAVEGLQPYSQYNCTVTASTSAGEGPPAQLTFNTIEDAPEDAPTNVVVVNTSSSSVLVMWTAPSIPNGIIIHYTLYVDYADGSAIFQMNTLLDNNYTVDGLQPYQLIRVQLSASTAAGEGPLSQPAMGRASEEDITAAEVSILMGSEEASIAGQSYSLLCMVTVEDGPISDPQILWLDPNGLPLSSEGEITINTQPVLDGPSLTRLTTYSISFSPLRTSHGGLYTCQATVTSPQQTLQETSSATYNITVEIPSPTTTILVTNTSLLAGSSLELSCIVELVPEVDTGVSVTITWKRHDEQINSDPRISVSSATEVSAFSYQSDLQVNILSQAVDSGNYTCNVIVSSSPPSEYVQDTTTSVIETIIVQIPILEVTITPASITVLDVAPYNTFILTCTASQPSSVTVIKVIEWRETRNGVTEAIVEDGISVNITSIDLEMPTSISSLYVRVNNGSDREITCITILEVPEDPAILQSANAQIIVKGPGEPVQPDSVSISNITSGSVSLQWIIPYIVYTPEEYRVLYGTSQQSLDQTSDSVGPILDLTATNLSYSLVIFGLQPGTLYHFQIENRNSIGSVMSEVISGVTLEAAPSGPPLSFTVLATGPATLTFSWSPPAEEDRNGFITGYTLSCQPDTEQLPAIFADAGEYIIDGFAPGSEYNCSVFASTSAGDGPPTSAAESTHDDIPGAVIALNVTAIPDTTVYISWRQPLITNGIIIFYQVTVETMSGTVDRRSVNALEVTINTLSPYVPYTITVSASTSVGAGESVQAIIFTREGAPDMPPKNIAVKRLNGMHMNVTWEKLTPAEARGFPTGYTITYDTLEKGQPLVEEVGQEESYKVIGNLEVTSSYVVTVAANTIEGRGVDSEEIVVDPPPSSLFQLRLIGIPDCNQWRFEDVENRISEITSAIITNLRQYCGCSVTGAYISLAELSCPEEVEEVIFRARIYSAPDANNSVLISDLQQWVQSRASIVVQRNRLDLDPNCGVLIQSFSDAICPKDTPTIAVTSLEEKNQGISLGIIVGVVVGGIGIIIAVILAFYIFHRIRHKRKYNLRERHRVAGLHSEESETYVPMQPVFDFTLSNSGAHDYADPRQFSLPPGYYAKAAEAAADEPPSLPPPLGTSALAKPNVYESFTSTTGSPQQSLKSDTDEYVKIDATWERPKPDDDPLYEHIPGDSKTQ